MKGDQKRYWKGLEEWNAGTDLLGDAEDEFTEVPLQIEGGPSRRGFLKAAGFSFAGAMLAGCGRAPVQKAMPYLQEPPGIVPGRSYYYASTCEGCTAGCGLLAKVRDGRPIKLEGNPQHPLSRGGLCAAGQASILGLYDSLRLKEPIAHGRPSRWDEVDRAIVSQLETIRKSGGAVRFVTETITSPTAAFGIDQFLKGFPDARHVVYDPLSCSAILDAHEETHGARVLPRYHFDKAEVIASFDADFLGTWISPVEFTKDYTAGRRVEESNPSLAYHVQFEGRMSITGSKADRRARVSPTEVFPLMAELASRLEARNSSRTKPAAAPNAVLGDLAERLLQARGRGLVVCGVQDVRAQVLCNYVNHLLGNYGSTLEIQEPSFQKQGSDRDLERLFGELEAGRVAAVFFYGVNPVYDLPGGDRLTGWLRKASLVVSFARRIDETAATAHYVCPDHHSLESWSDCESVPRAVSILQPAIRPLGDTRAMVESLAAWSGTPKHVSDIVRESWRERVFPRQKQETSFAAFWERSVQAGYAQVEPRRVAGELKFQLPERKPAAATTQKGFELVLYPTVAMLDGRNAYNPWLQELPDPVTKVTWDNYASLAPSTAEQLGVGQGDVVRIETGRSQLELPVVLQPGQHERVVAVALGYGRKESERFAGIGPRWIDALPGVGPNGLVGRNAAPLLTLEGGTLRYSQSGVRLTRTGKNQMLACTQMHYTLTGRGEKREIIAEVSLASLLKSKASPETPTSDLWPDDHPETVHRWGMTVDLNACTGCSACVISCQAENNIPVVGKDEVRRKREMHWIRIDRYYSGPPDEVEVAHQPMMCQQCEHAPCETVCPVLATVHSAEGLNQQVYNRCIGTRYCENNCPYKVRRFNWFHYVREDRLANLVLNPDVAVRSRGVMEKCSFCVQRIQEAKITALRNNQPVRDGDIQTACQQSCPAQAIVFGDLDDPHSRVSQLMRSRRQYKVLEEINVRPSVGYLKVVRRG